jgi:Lipocalin-like domain
VPAAQIVKCNEGTKMTIRERLIGSWKLTGYTETPFDGGPEKQPLGDDPLGAIIYNPDGYMSAQLSRPPEAAPDPREPHAYSGPFTVDEESGVVTHHLDVCVIPALIGTTQSRRVKFLGDDKFVQI